MRYAPLVTQVLHSSAWTLVMQCTCTGMTLILDCSQGMCVCWSQIRW